VSLRLTFKKPVLDFPAPQALENLKLVSQSELPMFAQSMLGEHLIKAKTC
jgi:hypothetical protein